MTNGRQSKRRRTQARACPPRHEGDRRAGGEMTEAFLEALGGMTMEANTRAAQPGRDGRTVTGTCLDCGTFLLFVEDLRSVEFVGAIGLTPPCLEHRDESAAIGWAYNLRRVKWGAL